MKKNIIMTGAFALAAAAVLTSCDWTDPEPVDLTYDNITAADGFDMNIWNFREGKLYFGTHEVKDIV